MKNKTFIFLILSICNLSINSMDFVSNVFNKSLDEFRYLDANDYSNNDENFEHDIFWKTDFKECVRLIKNNDLESFKNFFELASINSKNIDRRYDYAFDKITKEEEEFIGPNEDKKTLLMIAVEKNNKQIIEFLIDKGANVNAFYSKAEMWSQFSALSLAVIKNDFDSVKLLISKGATLDCLDNFNSAGFYSYFFGQKEYGKKYSKSRLLGAYLQIYDFPNLEMIKILINNGYVLDNADEIDWMECQELTEYRGDEYLIEYIFYRKFDLEVVKFLFDIMKIHRDLLYVVFNGISVYRNGDLEFAKYLIESGMYDPNFYLDGSILQCAIFPFKNLEYVKYLIKKGADVNYVDYDGSTALTEACERGLTSIVKELLISGADFTYKTPEGTALEIAKKSQNKELIEVLENWPKLLSQTIQDATSLISDVSGVVAEYLTDEPIKKHDNGFINSLEESVKKKKRYRE